MLVKLLRQRFAIPFGAALGFFSLALPSSAQSQPTGSSTRPTGAARTEAESPEHRPQSQQRKGLLRRMMGNTDRHGFQSGLLLAGNHCINSKNGDCEHSQQDPATQGKTRAGFAFSKEIGYRLPFLFIGGSYSFGYMRPKWELQNQPDLQYKLAYQHSLLAIIRPTLPLWRFDLGVSIAPGWSRQVFRRNVSFDREYTQGFALGTGYLASFYITRKWIIGFRQDWIFNAHDKACVRSMGFTDCREHGPDAILPVHQMHTGLYFSHMW